MTLKTYSSGDKSMSESSIILIWGVIENVYDSFRNIV